jgi:hypothetical protein
LAYTRRLRERSEARYERQLGINTVGNVPIKAENGLAGDAVDYMPTAYWIIDELLDELSLTEDRG